jgi:hypothetical protein
MLDCYIISYYLIKSRSQIKKVGKKAQWLITKVVIVKNHSARKNIVNVFQMA